MVRKHLEPRVFKRLGQCSETWNMVRTCGEIHEQLRQIKNNQRTHAWMFVLRKPPQNNLFWKENQRFTKT